MVKLPATIPSVSSSTRACWHRKRCLSEYTAKNEQCCCTRDSLNLPSYDTDPQQTNIDQILLNPPSKPTCACGHTFAELGEAQMKRMQMSEQEDQDAIQRSSSGPVGMSRTASGRGGEDSRDRGRDRMIDEEREKWARREEKDREARSSSRSRYD